jgi:TatA/E family protein of Tat protein translocase
VYHRPAALDFAGVWADDRPEGGFLRTMFGLGVPELIFILLLALLIFGPKRLPEIGRTLGRGMSEFRKASNELTRSLNTELALDETPTPPAARVNQMDSLRTPRAPAQIDDVPPAVDTVAETEPATAPAAIENRPIEPS